MSVISLTITDSELQIAPGIPKYVSVEANIPVSIFYTLDGNTPTVQSNIYFGNIFLPANSVVLSIFATNGIDNSDVIVRNYLVNIGPIRASHGAISADNQPGPDNFPFGDTGIDAVIATPYAPGGITVDDSTIPNQTIDGYDENGNPVGGTDLPLTDYEIIFSETNVKGERGHLIGTLPEVTIKQRKTENVRGSTDMNSQFFDPRALVIFQDANVEPYDPNINQMNKASFSTENYERVRDGSTYSMRGIEGNPARGTFVNAFYNPSDRTTTYYYLDSSMNRWIISKNPAGIPPSPPLQLSNVVFGRGDAAKYVYKDLVFHSRRLY